MTQFLLRTAIIFSLFILTGFSVIAQHTHTKTCGSDHMADLIKQQFPEHAEAWEDFQQRVIPALSEYEPVDQRAAAPILRIPVVVHVIHSGEAIGTGSNLSVAQIQAQIDILNEDFSAQNANFNQTPSQWTSVIGNPDIQFCLANVDPGGNPSNGITRHNLTVTGTNTNNSNIEDEIKPQTTWNANIYYNIWTLPIPGTTANGGTVGYAYLPSNFAIGSDFDGSVIDWRWFGAPGFSQSGYKTLTHETGHYLGLPHTFNETDCNGDDNIDDTPNISAATASLIPSLSCSNNNFPTGPSSCGNEHMYVNYMDYVNSDYCYTSFTAGQIAVMRGVLEGDRPFNYGSRLALINNSNTACADAANNIGIVSVTQPTAGTTCTPGPVTPQVVVGNFGTETVTTFSVSYQIDNGTAVTENFVDNIPSGETITVSLPAFTPPGSAYDFTVYTQNPNGVTDTQPDNDTTSVSSLLVTPQGLPLLENFTATAINPTAAGSYTFNPDTDDFAWQHVPTSANGSAGGSIMFDNYEGDSGNNPFGTIDAFISPVLNLSNSSNTTLTFDVAYARYENNGQFFNDSMIILVSTDCGSTYNELVFNEGGATLETGTATSDAFTPSPNEWESRTVNLNNYDGQPSVSIAFVNISGWGNRLFVDNININAEENSCDIATAISTIDANCFGEDGFAQITVQSGTAPYSYLWETGDISDILNAPSGTYQVTVTDANGCTDVAFAQILEPAPLSLGVDKTNETTAGANDGTATTNVSGGTGPGYTFNWSNNATTSSVSNLSPGNYSVTVTDQQECSNEVSFVIQPGPVDCSELSLTLQPVATSCADSNDGSINSISTGGSGPYQYNWSNGMFTQNINNISSGIYQLTITDQLGCSLSKTTTVNAPPPLTAILSATENQLGSAPPDGTASVSANGGVGNYFYQWSNGGTTATITGLSAGVYSVTVFDNNECTWTGDVEVTNEEIDCSSLNLNITSSNISCNGATDGFISTLASGGSPEYIYQWNNGMNTASIDNLPVGVYQVTITDVNGCSVVETTEISEPAPIISNISADSDPCNSVGGTVSVDPTGGMSGYQVTWSNGVTGFNNNITQSGNYQVTITDAAGCTTTDAISITVSNSVLAIDLSTTDVSCAGDNDGFAILGIVGGTLPISYEWSTGETGNSIDNLEAGTYSVEVTDGMGCQRNQIFTVDAPAPIVLNCSGTPENNGADGFVQVSGSGGSAPYNYSWNTGDTGSFIQGIINGNYQVTVTDQNGCSNVCSVNLTPTNTETPANFTTLNIFPNPASEQLFIHADLLEYESVRISLVNLIGQTVKSETTGGTTIRNTMDVTDLAAGTYLLRLETENGTAIRKVVIF